MRPSQQSSSNNVCKCGFGEEQTKGEYNTTGAPLQEGPEIKFDHRHSLKLYMPRNHPRVVQYSTDLLQSWRANRDVQVLMYSCDPKNPDVLDIARVTDYIVAYSCKGNATMQEEREQNKHMVLEYVFKGYTTEKLLTRNLIPFLPSADEITGDKHDIVRVCKQAMNKAASKRLISKQEAVVLLGELDLCYCTETIESVSISNSKRVTTNDSSRGSGTIVARYKKRKKELEMLSLYEFYHLTKNNGNKGAKNAKIPNFVGVNGTPKFPVTSDYAKNVLIIHKPWREYPDSNDWIGEFNRFINEPGCPLSAQLAYQRVYNRWVCKTQGYDPRAEVYDNSKNPMEYTDTELMDLVGLHKSPDYQYDDSIMKDLERGFSFKWDKDPIVSAC